MFKNYFKTAVKNLTRHKTFSSINILGLAIGLASALLLFVVVKYELSYNKSQPNYKRIFHVVTEDESSEGKFYTPGIPFPSLAALRTDFPDITTGALLANYGSQVTVLKEGQTAATSQKKFIEPTGFFFCDPEFFSVFTYQWLAGSPKVLSEPNVTILTQAVAERYFGNWKEATGKHLLLDNAIMVRVAGILKDPPAATDYPLQIVTSYATVLANPGVYFYSEEWGATSSNFQLFMLLPPHVQKADVDKGLVAFSRKHYKKDRRAVRTHFLQGLDEVHFDQRFDVFGDHTTSKTTLWTLSLIAVFIVVMACINFINLSTAQAGGRSKEIGVRKVLGANRKSLFGQLMGETFLVVLTSTVLALAIAAISLPLISRIAMIREPLSIISPADFLWVIPVVLMVTLIAGSYPALILTRFRPALALKNKISLASVGGISIRRALVILQFAISQILIIATIIVVSQMDFVKNADLGFNKEAVFVINSNLDSTAQSRQNYFRQEVLKVPGVRQVSFSSDVPSSQNNSYTNFGFDHKTDYTFNINVKYADDRYFDAFGIQFLAGNPFRESDTINQLVINETLMHKLGYQDPEAIIGKDINMGQGLWHPISGVVRDFKTNTLKDIIQPLVIASRKSDYYVSAFKLQSANLSATRAQIEDKWNASFPEYAFSGEFLSDSIENFYRQDQQLSLLYKIFAGIAIFISCLGLYGLVTFMAVQKTKEIGVRKVLGANVRNIVLLFSKEFTVLVLIGFVIAVPAGWFMMNHYLQDFVYRIALTPASFVLAACISLLLAWLAVGYKSIKAAVANPVKSLRTE